MEERNNLIDVYFRIGLSQQEIVSVLSIRHKIVLSARHLRRILKNRKLTRRKYFSDILDVAIFIEEQLQSSGRLHGYRWMHVKCIKEGLVVRKEDVRLLLGILDADGVASRKKRCLKRRAYFSKGPNYLWHIDGYDKLKPYGICINGCIDGFSRSIMWLKAYYTNSDPKLIAGYFVEKVTQLKGCPLVVRTDLGTENCYIRDIQKFLRRNGADNQADNAFIYGRSTSNQRIEAWWGQLRRHSAQYWIDLFKALQEAGLFIGTDLEKSLIQFCFTAIIQTELDDVVDIWNAHRIRRVAGSNMPHGKPFLLYNLPEIFGTRSYLYRVCEVELSCCVEECTFCTNNPCLIPEVYELCSFYTEESGLPLATNVDSALELYKTLRQLLFHDLNLNYM